jgi:sodium-dependent phosphate transporter
MSMTCFPSNAIGPVIAIWMIYTEGSVHQNSETPLYLLFYGGVGMSVGLCVWGQRVMKTIGEDLTKIAAST